jgi:hypothetical protein
LGSGMGKNPDPGSGINIPDPQHWKIQIKIHMKRYGLEPQHWCSSFTMKLDTPRSLE